MFTTTLLANSITNKQIVFHSTDCVRPHSSLFNARRAFHIQFVFIVSYVNINKFMYIIDIIDEQHDNN